MILKIWFRPVIWLSFLNIPSHSYCTYQFWFNFKMTYFFTLSANSMCYVTLWYVRCTCVAFLSDSPLERGWRGGPNVLQFCMTSMSNFTEMHELVGIQNVKNLHDFLIRWPLSCRPLKKHLQVLNFLKIRDITSLRLSWKLPAVYISHFYKAQRNFLFFMDFDLWSWPWNSNFQI